MVIGTTKSFQESHAPNRIRKSYFETTPKGVFSETDRGTQQGSVLSPLLANIALHGLETHLCSHFPRQRRDKSTGVQHSLSWKPQIIRYADGTPVQA